jgi:hypothetical protein
MGGQMTRPDGVRGIDTEGIDREVFKVEERRQWMIGAAHRDQRRQRGCAGIDGEFYGSGMVDVRCARFMARRR